MKLAVFQLNPVIGDFQGNTSAILAAAGKAGVHGAELAIFPEMAIPGYPPQDLIEDNNFLKGAGAALQRVAQATAEPGMPAILCGTVLPSDKHPGKRARNVAALCFDGAVQFVQTKMLLPFYDVFDEQRYFEPATTQSLVAFKGEVLAVTICEDAWNDKGYWPDRNYSNDPVERLMAQRLDGRAPTLLVNLSASPYWEGKQAVRRGMVGALARRYGVPALMAAQVGGNDSLVFDGASFAVDAQGEAIATAASFREDFILFDTEALEPYQAMLPTQDGAEAAWNALVLGVRDYVRKCGFRDALVGLSGGIDSAVVAAIAVEALGSEHVRGVGMPSEYSSTGSIDDARDLAERLGIRFDLLTIHSSVGAQMQTLEPLFAGTEFGLAEENLQSRTRGALLMAISNKFGALVLTTGNKSEMATGYCTLYGDMVGALAVIGDVWKTRVYDLARYANREREVIPQNTILKPPSAELRPGQMDTDSLPSYEVLDPVLQAYVERYQSAEQIAEELALPVDRVEQVLKLVERSEYKRQQAAPVLKVTAKSFGTGRRFPLAARLRHQSVA